MKIPEKYKNFLKQIRSDNCLKNFHKIKSAPIKASGSFVLSATERIAPLMTDKGVEAVTF